MPLWQSATWRAAVIGRWLALLFGTLTVLFFLSFLFGEGLPHLSDLSASDRLSFAALAALFLGLALAWKWEGLGGLLGIASFAVLVAIGRDHLTIWAFDIPAGIAVVHIACWWRLRAGAPAGIAPWRLSRNILLASGAVAAIFVLLCLNEMFGRPPLMTPALHPSGTLLGPWTQSLPFAVSLTIHEDASVTGTIDGTDVTDGRIAFGRSWFGRLLHWNSDYVISGRISDRDFAAPLATSRPGWADPCSATAARSA